ncbi:glycoside hydrolase family 88 protein [Parabacteroides sp. OttesenSCG-928-N08]|nr:glycoside hydrolase family 88 protein [Parabacteroides sp. OttesenSCG-928-N08]
MKKTILFFILFGCVLFSCSFNKKVSMDNSFDGDRLLAYCGDQIDRTLAEISHDSCALPRSMEANATRWSLINAYDWTSGFWPGILWYNYEITQDDRMKELAIQYTECLRPLASPEHEGDHDIGFQLFNSFGHAYKKTANEDYKEILFIGAEKLAGLYNKKVGTILSWPLMVEQEGWPHNTILDNMMNLEILFWAAKNGGKREWYDMAYSHAKVTMLNQFREDGTGYHVAVYDTLDGQFIKGVTNQGYSDQSFWARGQAWAIYGYTMVYRETGDNLFLRFAEKITDAYLSRLPEDYVPFWDFDDPAIPQAPKDASSAAITASALLELSELEDDPEKGAHYRKAAIRMLASLSSENYLSGDDKPSFLLHATGNYPSGYEIDASINYADYYFLEALVRYKKLQSEKGMSAKHDIR